MRLRSAPVRYNRREMALAYLFLAPFLLIFSGFVLLPVVQSFLYSFTRWEGIGPKTWVGFANYREMFLQDEKFLIAIKNNCLWLALSVTIPLAISLWISNMLVHNNLRLAKYYQLILFLPQVLASVITATIWKWIYNPVFGPVSQFFKAVGLKSFVASGILGQSSTVMYALFVVSVWTSVGYYTVIFTSAMQGVDTTLYDAADIDGCSRSRRFFAVTLPGIRNTMTTVLLLIIIGSFQVFDLVAIMTTGGPGYSSYMISYYVYQAAFINNRVGYATALAVTLSLFLLIISRTFTAVRERQDR